MLWLMCYLFFLCSIGVHKFYLGQARRGIIYLLLGIIGWATVLTSGIAAIAGDTASAGGLGVFGTICLFILGILIIIDLFTLPKQVRKVSEEAENKIIDELLMNKS
ncbi:MAG: TM2 domain-containing protein [Acetomicrobium sp.]|nr:TM2 domain-containing protein [Acetomicrobium sp.]